MEPIVDLSSERRKLGSLLMEGLESGPAREFTAEDRAELKRGVWQRHEMKGIAGTIDGNTDFR